jgi:hypothetical protein
MRIKDLRAAGAKFEERETQRLSSARLLQRSLDSNAGTPPPIDESEKKARKDCNKERHNN